MKRVWRGHEYKINQLYTVPRIQNSFVTILLAIILIMQLLTCLTNLPYSSFQLSLILAVDINNPISVIFVQRWDVYLIIVLIVATICNALLICFLLLLFCTKTNRSILSNIQFFFAFLSFPLAIPIINIYYPSYLILSRMGSRNLVTLPHFLLKKLQNSITLKVDGNVSSVNCYLIPFLIYTSIPLLGFFALAILSIMYIHWSDYDIKSPVIITNGCLLLPHLFTCIVVKLFEILHYPYYYGHSEILMAVLLCILSTLFCLYCINTSIFLTLLQNLISILFSVTVTFFCFMHLAYSANWVIPSTSVQIFIVFILVETSFFFTNFQFRHLVERTIRFLAVGNMNLRSDTQNTQFGYSNAEVMSGNSGGPRDLQLANSEPFSVTEIMSPLSSSSKLILSLAITAYFFWVLISYPFMRISGRVYLRPLSSREKLIQSDQRQRSEQQLKDVLSPVATVNNFQRTENNITHQAPHAHLDNNQSTSTWIRFTQGKDLVSVPLLPKTEYDKNGNYIDLEFTNLLRKKQAAKERHIFEKTRRIYNSEQYIRDFQNLNAASNVPMLSFLKMLAEFNRLACLDKMLIKSYMRDYKHRKNLAATKNPGLYFRRLEDVLLVSVYLSNFYKYKILHTTFSGQKAFNSSNVLHYCFIKEICFVLEAHWSNSYAISLLYYSLLLSVCNDKATVAKETGDLLNFGISSTDGENLFQQDMLFKRESQEEFLKFIFENKDSLMCHMQMKLDEHLDKIQSFIKCGDNNKYIIARTSEHTDAKNRFEATLERLHLRILESYMTAVSVDEKLVPSSSVITAWTNNMKLLRGQLNPEITLIHRHETSRDSRPSNSSRVKSVESKKLFKNAMKTITTAPRSSIRSSALSIFHLAQVYMRSIFGSTNEITSDIQLSELAITQTIVQLFLEIYKEQHNDINFAFLSLCQFHSSFEGAIGSFKTIQKRHKHDPIHTILHLMLLVFLPLLPLDSYHYRRLLDKYKNTNLIISNDGTPFYIKHNVNKVTIYRSYDVLSKFCSLKKFSRILYPLFANDKTVYDDRFIIESSLHIGTAETRPLLGKDSQFMYNVPGTVCKRILTGLDKERGKIKQYTSNIDLLNEMKRLRTITTVQNSRFIKKNPVTNSIYLSVTRMDYLDALVSTWGNKTRGAIKLITQKKSFIIWKVVEGIIYLAVISVFFALILMMPFRQLDDLSAFLGNLDKHVKTIDKIHTLLVSISHLPNNYTTPLSGFFKELKNAINNVNAYYPHWNPSVPIYSSHTPMRTPEYTDTWTVSMLPVYIQKKTYDLIKSYKSYGQNISYYKTEFSKLLEPVQHYADYFLKYSNALEPLDTVRLERSVSVQGIMWLLSILVIIFAYRMQVTFNQMRRDYTILLHLFIKLPVEIRKEVASYWISHNISRLRLADIFYRNLPAYCEGLLRDIKRLNNIETNPSRLDIEVLQGTRTNSDRYSRRMQMLLKKYISMMNDEANDTTQMNAPNAKCIRSQQRDKQILDIDIAQQDSRAEERLEDDTITTNSVDLDTQLTTAQTGVGNSQTQFFLIRRRSITNSQTNLLRHPLPIKSSSFNENLLKKQMSYTSPKNQWDILLYDIWRPLVLRKSFLSQDFKKSNANLYDMYAASSGNFMRSDSLNRQSMLQSLKYQKRRSRLMCQSKVNHAFNIDNNQNAVNNSNTTSSLNTTDTKDNNVISYSQKVRPKCTDKSWLVSNTITSNLTRNNSFCNEEERSLLKRNIESTKNTTLNTDTHHDTSTHNVNPLDSKNFIQNDIVKDKQSIFVKYTEPTFTTTKDKEPQSMTQPKDSFDWNKWRKRRVLSVLVGILIFIAFTVMQILGYVYMQSYSSVLQSMQKANLKSGYLADKLSSLSLDELNGHIAHHYAITLDERLYTQYSAILTGPTVHDLVSEIFINTELMQARSWLFSSLLRELEAAVSELRRLNNIGVFLAYLSQYKSDELIDTSQPNMPCFKSNDFFTEYVYVYNNYNITAEILDPNSIRSRLSRVVMDANFEEQIYGYNVLNLTKQSYTDLLSDITNPDPDARRTMALATFNSLYYHKIVYVVRKLSHALLLELTRLQSISFLDEALDGRDFYSLYFRKFIKPSLISNLGQRDTFMNIFYHGNTFVNPVSLTHQYVSKRHTDSYQRMILQPLVHLDLSDNSIDAALQKILTMKLVDINDFSNNIDTYVIRQFMIYILMFIVGSCISYCSFILIYKYLYKIQFTKLLVCCLTLMGVSLFLLIISFVYLTVKVASTRDLTNFNRSISIVAPLLSIRTWILDIALKSKHLATACLDIETLMHSTPPQNATAFTFQTIDRLAGSLAITMTKGLSLEQGGYDPLYPDPHAYYFDNYLRSFKLENKDITDEEVIHNYELNNRTLDSRAMRNILKSRVKKVTEVFKGRHRNMYFITGPNGNAYAIMNELMLLLPEQLSIPYYNAILYTNELESKHFLTWLRAEIEKRTGKSLTETYFLRDMIKDGTTQTNVLYYYKRPTVTRFSQHSHLLSLNTLSQSIIRYLGATRRLLGYYCLWRDKTLDKLVQAPDPIINPFIEIVKNLEEITPIGILYALNAPRKFVKDMIDFNEPTNPQNNQIENNPYRYQYSVMSIDPTPHLSGYPYIDSDNTQHGLIALLIYRQQISKYHLDNYIQLIELLNTIGFSNLEQAANKYDAWIGRSGLTIGLFKVGPYVLGIGIITCVIVIMDHLTTTSSVLFPFLTHGHGAIDQLRPDLLFKQRKYYSVMITIRKILLILITVLLFVTSLFIVYYANLLLYATRLLHVLTRLLYDTSITKSKLMKVFSCMMSSSEECKLVELSLQLKELKNSVDDLFYSISFLEINKGLQSPYIRTTLLNQSMSSQRDFRQRRLFLDSTSIYPIVGGSLIFESYIYKVFYDVTNLFNLSLQHEAIHDLTTLYWAIQQGDIFTAMLGSVFKEARELWSVDHNSSQEYLQRLVTSGLSNPLYKSIAGYLADNRIDFFQLASTLNITITNKDRYDIYREIYQKTINRFSTIFDIEYLTSRNVNWTQYAHNLSYFSTNNGSVLPNLLNENWSISENYNLSSITRILSMFHRDTMSMYNSIIRDDNTSFYTDFITESILYRHKCPANIKTDMFNHDSLYRPILQGIVSTGELEILLGLYQQEIHYVLLEKLRTNAIWIDVLIGFLCVMVISLFFSYLPLLRITRDIRFIASILRMIPQDKFKRLNAYYSLLLYEK